MSHHSAKDHISLGETKRFRKAALTGGRRRPRPGVFTPSVIGTPDMTRAESLKASE